MASRTTWLETQYRAYLAARDAREPISPYVHSTFYHNSQPTSVAAEEAHLADVFDRAPDNWHNVLTLVACPSPASDPDSRDGTVAVRLWFECKPLKPLMGYQPTGRWIGFGAHLVTRLRQGKVEEVFSICQMDSVAKQLSGEAEPPSPEHMKFSSTPTPALAPSPDSVSALESLYKSMLGAWNRQEPLTPYLHFPLMHNGHINKTLADFEKPSAGLRDAAADGVESEPEIILASPSDAGDGINGMIVVRAHLSCTLKKEFMGLVPTGKPIRLAEQMFILVQGGKAKEMWVMVDSMDHRS